MTILLIPSTSTFQNLVSSPFFPSSFSQLSKVRVGHYVVQGSLSPLDSARACCYTYLARVEADEFYFQEMQCCRNSVCKDLFTEFLKLLWTLQVAFHVLVFSENNTNATREMAWERQKPLVFRLLKISEQNFWTDIVNIDLYTYLHWKMKSFFMKAV